VSCTDSFFFYFLLAPALVPQKAPPASFFFSRSDWNFLSSGRFSRIRFLGPSLVLFVREAGGIQALAPASQAPPSLIVVPRVNIFSFTLIPFDLLPELLYEPPLADSFFFSFQFP
jgi:hypothetical protein